LSDSPPSYDHIFKRINKLNIYIKRDNTDDHFVIAIEIVLLSR